MLPFRGYNGKKDAAQNARGQIARFLSDRIALGANDDVVRDDADALDARCSARL
jgi:RNA processing factor Prp31